MQLISTTLDSTQLGEPAQFGNLTLYPLLADSPGTPAYLTLDEAIERKLARVTATVRPEEARQGAVSKDEQLSEQGSVPELFFENLADRDILLADGEELVGARQNRILNISILVAAKKRIVVPVSCVESGRWSYRSRDFASSGRNLYAKARAEKMRHVSASMRHSGERRSDQAALWQSIACKEEALGVSSATHSMGDIYEQRCVVRKGSHACTARPLIFSRSRGRTPTRKRWKTIARCRSTESTKSRKSCSTNPGVTILSRFSQSTRVPERSASKGASNPPEPCAGPSRRCQPSSLLAASTSRSQRRQLSTSSL